MPLVPAPSTGSKIPSDFLLVPRQIIEQQCRFQEVSCALALSRSLPTVQLSHRLLLESMGNANLSDRSEAALEAMICLLRPAFQQRDAGGRVRAPSSGTFCH